MYCVHHAEPACEPYITRLYFRGTPPDNVQQSSRRPATTTRLPPTPDTYTYKYLRACYQHTAFCPAVPDRLFPPLFLVCLQTGPIEDVASLYPDELGRGVQGRVYSNQARRIALKYVKHVWWHIPQWVILEEEQNHSSANHNHNDDTAHITPSDLWIQLQPFRDPMTSYLLYRNQCILLRQWSPPNVSCTRGRVSAAPPTNTYTQLIVPYSYANACAYKQQRETITMDHEDPPHTDTTQPQTRFRGPYFHICSALWTPAQTLGGDHNRATSFVWRLPPNLLDAYVSRAIRDYDVLSYTDGFVYVYDECRCPCTPTAAGLDKLSHGHAYDWRQYIWMECIRGPSLLRMSVRSPTQRVVHGQSSTEENSLFWMHVCLQILGTLAVAQERCSYKHHDLTVQNIFGRYDPAVDEPTFVTLGFHLRDARLSPRDVYYVIPHVPRTHVVVIGDHGFASVRYGPRSANGHEHRVARYDMDVAEHMEHMGPWSDQLTGWEGYDVQTFLHTIRLFARRARRFPAHQWPWTRLLDMYSATATSATPLGRPKTNADVSPTPPYEGLLFLLQTYAHFAQHSIAHCARLEVDAATWHRYCTQEDFHLVYAVSSSSPVP